MPLQTKYNFSTRKRSVKKLEYSDSREKNNVKRVLFEKSDSTRRDGREEKNVSSCEFGSAKSTLYEQNAFSRQLKLMERENSPPKKIKLAQRSTTQPTRSLKGSICDENSHSPNKGSKPMNSKFICAKQVFHTGLPSRLIGRSEEVSQIRDFINGHLMLRQPGSMYISGAPGTGKTSSFMFVMENIAKKHNLAFINCMSVSNTSDIYKNIAREFGVANKTKNIVKSLEKYITDSKEMNILVLDEVDHLDTKACEVLYSLFEWPQLRNSTLILIGIANALDLTDRILPRLQAFQCQPMLIHFQPYTKDQIVSILEDRLGDISVIHPLAVQLCARKIAACTGDIRKALDVCRRAVEIAEKRIETPVALRPISDDRRNPGSPMKSTVSLTRLIGAENKNSHSSERYFSCSPSKLQSDKTCDGRLFVDIQDIDTVLHQVYGSRLQTLNSSHCVTMPLQHMLLICTLVLMKKYCKVQEMTLAKVYSVYKRICKKRDIAFVGECGFPGLCRLVESRGFVELRAAKVARMSKIMLKIEENEAEHVIQDKAMLPSILADRSVLTRA